MHRARTYRELNHLLLSSQRPQRRGGPGRRASDEGRQVGRQVLLEQSGEIVGDGVQSFVLCNSPAQRINGREKGLSRLQQGLAVWRIGERSLRVVFGDIGESKRPR